MRVLNQITSAATGEATEEWIDLPGVVTEDEAQADTLLSLAQEARAERNGRLAACDWTTLADVPLTDIQRFGWEQYRQVLRDVTNQAGFPSTIDWPAPPA